MDTVTLQVPMPKSIRNQAALVASEYGFSSLQEVIRLLLNKFAKRHLVVSIEEPVIKLSDKAARRYDKMIDDVRSGKVVPTMARSADELFKQLGI